MTRWNRETILIVFSQASLKLETNNKAGMLGFPELWRFFFLAIPAFHSLILYFISSLFPAKPLKGNVVQQINKWPDSPGRINTVEDD